MPAKNPRVSVVLERPLYESIRHLAKTDGISISLKVRDLLKEALDTYEDSYLLEVAQERAKTWNRAKALTTEQIWRKLGLEKRRKA